MKTVLALPPKEFSSAEIDDFVAFALAGGEVEPNGLREHVMNAKSIAFLRSNECVVGVAGLKRPRAAYRTKVEKASGFALSEESFPFELGWVFILPSARGANLSLPLCQPVVAAACGAAVFATSSANNHGMHATLKNLGFYSAGCKWVSKRREDNLLLFIRNAPSNPSIEL